MNPAKFYLGQLASPVCHSRLGYPELRQKSVQTTAGKGPRGPSEYRVLVAGEI